MARLRADFVRGTITNNPLAIGDTTINSAALASLPVVSSPDICVLILDPGASAPEIVHVTAHSSAATSATISRGQEGSTARSHIQGTAFAHGATSDDFNAPEGSTVLSTGATDGYVLTADGAGAAAWEAIPSGVTLVGSNTTEQTTTSTSAVDLVTISSLSIAATTPVMIVGNFRKTSGAAVRVGLGLKVNSTVVGEASTSSGIVAYSGATDEAQNGGFVVFLMPRRTNYQGGAYGFFNERRGGTSTGNTPANDANVPTDTITSIAIRAISGNALVTAAVTDVRIYTMGT